MGAIPQIAFTDYEGASVVLTTPEGETNKGLAYLVLPMKNAEGTKVGSVKVNASYAGVEGIGGTSGSAGVLNSLFTSAGNIFIGGGLQENVISSGTDAASRTSLFGSLSASDLLEQIKNVNSNITSLTSSSYPASE
ncbi:TPA: fimbrial protein, partial [Escherichia coli]|nr:fimbrial protein [Escherichia coli]